jgi:hypothetical protein
MDILDATRGFERWMAQQIPIVKPDLAQKHKRMAESAFVFLRGTFYRWVQLWPGVCAALVDAPAVPTVGDLHVENFGTWRDIEGRLVWGVNDVDEACALPYTADLVRLGTSAELAVRACHFDVSSADLCEAILEGYTTSLEQGGRPFVLAEHRRWLRRIALNELRDPATFWPKFDGLQSASGEIPHAALRATLPEPRLPYRVLRRVAGVGSLGRRRVVALAEWYGARIAREAKAWLPSAAVWATGRASIAVNGAALIARAARMPDPFVRIQGGWIVRRLAPDCSRIEVSDMPKVRDELKLLRAMGAETANFHVSNPRAIRNDLKGRPRRWLERAATAMADAVDAEWRRWVKLGG